MWRRRMSQLRRIKSLSCPKVFTLMKMLKNEMERSCVRKKRTVIKLRRLEVVCPYKTGFTTTKMKKPLSMLHGNHLKSKQIDTNVRWWAATEIHFYQIFIQKISTPHLSLIHGRCDAHHVIHEVCIIHNYWTTSNYRVLYNFNCPEPSNICTGSLS